MAENLFEQDLDNFGLPQNLEETPGLEVGTLDQPQGIEQNPLDVPVATQNTGLPDPPTKKYKSYEDALNAAEAQGAKAFPLAGNDFLRSKTIPGDRTRKYDDMTYGFRYGVDMDDFYGQMESPLTTFGKGVGRFVVGVGSKVTEGVGYITGLLNPNNWDADIISKASDNAISEIGRLLDDKAKNDWLPTFQEAEDRDKGFWQKAFTDPDGDFWMTDVVDGLAFLTSAWIPGLALSKIQLGAKLATLGSGLRIGLGSAETAIEGAGAAMNYTKSANTAFRSLDKFNAWALATASEAMFEAREVRDRVAESLKYDEFGRTKINPNTNAPYTDGEIKKVSAAAAQNTFLMNAGLLAATNAFELKWIGQIFDKGAGRAAGIIGGQGLTDALGVRVATSGIDRFLSSRTGAFLKGVSQGVAVEGFLEENGQLAIQRINEAYGTSGRVASLANAGEVFKQYLSQTGKALAGEDKEASLSIGIGGILGGIGSGVGGVRTYNRDKAATAAAVEAYNLAQQNWLKFGNIHQTKVIDDIDENGNAIKKEVVVVDEAGNPVVDQNKLSSIATSYASVNAAIDESSKISDKFRRNALRDTAWAQFVVAHINAGIGDTVIEKLDSLRNAKAEDLAKLGFIMGENSEAEINRYKALTAAIIKQNELLNSDIMFDNTEEDAARKSKMTEVASEQAVYKSLLTELVSELTETKNGLLNSENTSLSDGLVEQLNELAFRLNSQKEVIASMEETGIPSQSLSIAKEVLAGIQKEFDAVIANNETTVSQLKKDDDGFYQYEKEERNQPGSNEQLAKKSKLKGEIQNHVKTLGLEWAKYADTKNGKENFLRYLTDEMIGAVDKQMKEKAVKPQATEKPSPIGKKLQGKYKQDETEDVVDFQVGAIFTLKDESGKDNTIEILDVNEKENSVTIRVNENDPVIVDVNDLAQMVNDEGWQEKKKTTRRKRAVKKEVDEEGQEETEDLEDNETITVFSNEGKKPKFEEIGFNKTFGRQYKDEDDTEPNTENGTERFFQFTAKHNLARRGYAFEVITKDNDKFGIRDSEFNPDDIKVVIVKKVPQEDGTVKYQYVDVNNQLIPEGQESKENIIYRSLVNRNNLDVDRVRNDYTVGEETTDDDIQEEIDQHVAYQKSLEERVLQGPVYLDILAALPGIQRIEYTTAVGEDGKRQLSKAEVEGRVIVENPDFSDLRSVSNPDVNIGLRVSTGRGVVMAGIKAGRLVMQEYTMENGKKIWGDKVVRVFNSELNDDQKDTIIKAFVRLSELYIKKYGFNAASGKKRKKPLSVEDATEMQLIEDYLRHVLNWSRPVKGKVSDKYFWVQSGLHRGNTVIDFKKEDILKNRDKLLKGAFHHVNNKALQDNNSFSTIKFVKGKAVVDKNYDTYEEYLLRKTEDGVVPPVYSSLPLYSSDTPQRTSVQIVWTDSAVAEPEVEEEEKEKRPKKAKEFKASTEKTDDLIDEFLNAERNDITINGVKVSYEVEKGGIVIKVEKKGLKPKISKPFPSQKEIQANRKEILKQISQATGYVYGANKGLKALAEAAKQKATTAATVTQTTPYGTEAGPTLTTSTESLPAAETTEEAPKQEGPFFTIEDAVNNAVVSAGKITATVYQKNIKTGEVAKYLESTLPIPKGNLNAAKALLTKALIAQVQSEAEEPPFRLAMEEMEGKENFRVLDAWMNKVLPQIPVKRMGHLIYGKAYGAFMRGAIHMYKNAEIGTGFHEAFEAVWASYLTDEERSGLAQEFMSRPGTFYNKFTKETKPYSEASIYDVREMLAEEFRSYILGTTSLSGKVKSIFQKLWEFIQKILGLTPAEKAEMDSLVQKVFKDIGAGKFKNAKPIRDIMSLGAVYRSVGGLTQKESAEVLEGLNYYFFTELFKQGNNIDSILGNLDKKASNNLLNLLWDTATAQVIRDLEIVSPNIRNVVEAYKNDFYSEFKKNLDRYGVIFSEIEEDESKVTDTLGIRDSISIDPRSMTSTNVMLLMASLPQITTRNGRPVLVKNDLNLPKLVNTDKLHTTLLNELSNVVSIINKDGVRKNALDSMFEKLDTKYKLQDGTYRENYGWIRSLKIRLKQEDANGKRINPSSLSKDDILLRVSFTKSFSNARFVPEKLIISDEGYIYSTNPLVNVNENRIRNEWSNNLKVRVQNKQTDLVKIDATGRMVINRKGTDYSEMMATAKNRSSVDLATSLELLDMIGIKLSGTENDLAPYENSIREQALQIIDVIKAEEIEDVADLFGRNIVGGRINTLIAIESKFNSEDNILSYFNAEGEQQYSVGQTSLLSNMINILNSVQSLNDLIQTAPWLGFIDESGEVVLNAYQTNSELLKKGGLLFDNNGNRKNNTNLTYHVISGLGITEVDGNNTAKLQFPERVANKIHYLLNNVVFSNINSDKSTEFGIAIPGRMMATRKDVQRMLLDEDKKIIDMYVNHLSDEMHAAVIQSEAPANIQYYQDQVYQLGHFRDIIGKDMIAQFNKEVIEEDKDFEDFIDENREKIEDKIKTYLTNKIEDTVAFIKDLDLFIQPDKFRSDLYITDAVDNETLDELLGVKETQTINYRTGGTDSEFKSRSGYSENDLRILAGILAINEEVLLTEQHKLIYGHPAFYKDLPKRANGATSTKEPLVEDTDVVNWMDDNMVRNDGKVRSSDIHQTVRNISFKDMNVVSAFYKNIAESTFKEMSESGIEKKEAEKKIGARFNEDGTVSSFILDSKKDFTGVIKAYMSLNEADAMAMGLPDVIRDLLFMSGKFNSQREAQWDYEIAYEKLVRSGRIANAKGEKIKKTDPAYKSFTKAELEAAQEIYDKGNPGFVFEVLKPQYFGYAQTDNVTHPVFLKHALQPRFYRHVEGTQFEKLYIAAQKQKIDIIGFESGEKVGNMTNVDGQFVSLYKDNGDVNIEVTDKGYALPSDLPIQNLYSRFYGIQVEQSSKPKTEVVKGTQITKQVMSNFYDNGAAITSKIAGLIEEYNKTLRQMMKLGKENLINELGLEKTEKGYVTKDLSRLVKTLRREAEQRDLPDNIINAINYDVDTQDLQYPFDTLINKDKIDNILNSIVDSRVISEKMNGKSSPQVASTLYEANPRDFVYLKDGIYQQLTQKDLSKLTDEERKSIRMQSSDLKFYHSKDGAIQAMEVYISWPFADISPEELGLKLENGIYKIPASGIKGMDPELLKAIGFRIPTQGMNSVESMIIKGFTPANNGDMIVVPSEIVGKAGSDFDIDKINIYLPNYYVDLGANQYTGEQFATFMREDMINRGATPEQAEMLLSKFTTAELKQINESTYTEKGKLIKGAKTSLSDISSDKLTIEDMSFVKASLTRYNAQYKGKKKLRYIQPNLDTKAGLQNRLINIMSELILSPENYAQLVAPNGTATLKGLAEEIKEWKVEAGTKLLEDEKSPTYLRTFIGSNSIRERYLTAKRMVGIAALHSTFHVMSQVSGLKLNSKFKSKSIYYLISNAKEALEGVKDINIKLDHHEKDENGLFRIGHRLDKAGQFISELISEALSGFVDGAKDPFVFDLNFSLNTASTWFYLQHLGVPVKQVAYFFNQPILDSLFKETSKNRSSFKIINGENLTRKEMFYKVIAPYYDKVIGGDLEAMIAGAAENSKAQQRAIEGIVANELAQIRDEVSKFTPKQLADAIKQGENADPKLQIAVLMDYAEYEAQARQLSNFIQAISYDTGKTKTIQENMLQVGRWERAISEEFVNNPEAILEKTFLGEAKVQKEDIFNMFRNFFVTLSPELQEVFQPLYDKIDNPEFFMTKDDAVNLINRYQNHVVAYLLHTTPIKDEEGKEAALNTLYKDMFTGANSMAVDLYKYKNSEDPNISENLVIRELLPLMTDDATKTDNISLFRNRMDTFQINNVIEALNNLKFYAENTGDTNLVRFVNNLAKFSILQSGLQASFIDFKKVLSTEVYSDLVKAILERFKANPSIDSNQVWKTFHQNNWYNRSIVPKAPAWARIKDGVIAFSPNSTVTLNDFMVKYVRDPKISKTDLKKMKKDKTIAQAYKPVLFQKTENTTKKGYIIYEPISTLGNRSRMLEIYDNDQESILPGNTTQLDLKASIKSSEGWVSAKDMMAAAESREQKKKDQTPSENIKNASLKDMAMKAIQDLEKDVKKTKEKKEDESKKCNKKKK